MNDPEHSGNNAVVLSSEGVCIYGGEYVTSTKYLDGKIYVTHTDPISLEQTDAYVNLPSASGTIALTSDVTAAVASKANSADVYAKTETFTKDEVNAAIEEALTAANSWGEF
jgi:uncharacterized protein YqhQ